MIRFESRWPNRNAISRGKLGEDLLLGNPSTYIAFVDETERRDAMATLSVLKFNDPYGADRVLIALQGMQEREMITLEDAAVVSWPQGNGKPTTRQLHSTAGAGALGSAFWGFLFGLIFFVPFLGAAIGAGMGGLSGSLADVGISDDFIKEVREKVTEGSSALFALTSGATAPDKVVDELKAYDFEIISTNLPEEQENKLREAFAQE
jgi:uncharacterized membrane protein